MWIVSIGVSGTVLADPPPISAKDREVAREMVKRAIARSEAGDHAGAIKIYLQAYSLAPNALLLSNIGAEYQQDNKPEEALQYFCTYLDKDPGGTNASYATAQAKILQGQLGNKITGSDVCVAHKLAPLGDGAAHDADPAPPSRDRVEPASEPAPPSPESKPPAPGGDATLRYLGIASSVVGLVALSVGAYDGYRAKDISDQIDEYSRAALVAGWPLNIRNLQHSGEHYEDLQIRFLVIGGVLVTAGVALYVVGGPIGSGRNDRSDRPSVAVTPTSNGVSMSGRF